MDQHKTPQIGNQLCFPLYVIAKEITGLYRPLLEELDITYPQYLVMMVLWEHQRLTVNQIGEKLFLDSGTITPMLKRLEAKSYIVRQRKIEDERVVEISLTDEGERLQDKACLIPEKMNDRLNLSETDVQELKHAISKILDKINKK
ncbi:MarR family transcriptional regulator [Kaistella sp. BT6-1-3]|uniref:MarR family transcriptional regulator n=1 Tax=Kaistella yananensis TaxID=2989820 RepID=A0ABT3JP53_9FLAO|nr:MarR family transcriptional regulator [Kaistella yananensis]MCW4452538.1 MarR family transcriptional regulator [Kaistella yananensis]